MKIIVGSKNELKINAVKEVLTLYPDLFPDTDILGVDSGVDLYGHPITLEETVEGAIDRAKKVLGDCDYSFGLEGGLLKVPLTKSGYMEISVCAVYNGSDISLGLSPAFEWPEDVTKMILSGKADGSQAFKRLGLTKEDKLGAIKGGIAGILTKGRLTREELIKTSVIAALIRLENPEYYNREGDSSHNI
ncbi:MAG TPA: inosine/xanthosine triphosphatase [candidate division CPR3 bacterium]|uniref:inosine/xanthosine triphosphatase n=1 Tax=candidate division CPR3 bacterium TaxID=2268181 RepID=A0A7C1NZG5_UNCC3|nr:inosine/xanthosine triphosphatase [Patescibacteria group bacterium]HEB13527.1 inosine/xanthosine triphosphatase [candidate division CPR3 bacterium]